MLEDNYTQSESLNAFFKRQRTFDARRLKEYIMHEEIFEMVGRREFWVGAVTIFLVALLLVGAATFKSFAAPLKNVFHTSESGSNEPRPMTPADKKPPTVKKLASTTGLSRKGTPTPTPTPAAPRPTATPTPAQAVAPASTSQSASSPQARGEQPAPTTAPGPTATPAPEPTAAPAPTTSPPPLIELPIEIPVL